jgi:hypothetical protein
MPMSSMIDGTATLTMVESTMIRETPRLMTTRPHHRALEFVSTILSMLSNIGR